MCVRTRESVFYLVPKVALIQHWAFLLLTCSQVLQHFRFLGQDWQKASSREVEEVMAELSFEDMEGMVPLLHTGLSACAKGLQQRSSDGSWWGSWRGHSFPASTVASPSSTSWPSSGTGRSGVAYISHPASQSVRRRMVSLAGCTAQKRKMNCSFLPCSLEKCVAPQPILLHWVLGAAVACLLDKLLNCFITSPQTVVVPYFLSY